MPLTSFKTISPGIRVRANTDKIFRGQPDRYFTLRFSVNGKQVEEALGWASEGWNLTKAQNELAKLKVANTTGEGATTLREKRELKQKEREKAENTPTVRKVWEVYGQTLKGRASYKSFCSIVRKHLSSILDLKISDLSTAKIDSLRKEVEDKGLSPQTTKHVLGLVRQIIKWGAIHGYCEMPPIHILHFDMPSFDNTTTEFLDINQINQLLEALNAYQDQLMASAMKVALFTGMRRTAIFSLQWSDLDFDNKLICLRAEVAKNKKISYIPMTKDVENIFNDIRSNNDTDDILIFRQKNSYNRRIKNLINYIKNFIPEGYRPWHSLRHTFASQLASSGKADLLTLQKLLTHRDAAATQRYAHMADQSLYNAASQIGVIIEESKQ